MEHRYQQLRKFSPFELLSESELIVLAGKVEVKTFKKGEILFNHGDIDALEYFLLSGNIALISADDRKRVIDSDDPLCANQISKLRPRQYTCTAESASEVVVIDSDLLEAVIEASRSGAAGYGVEEIDDSNFEDQDTLVTQFFQAIDSDRLIIPSLPEVALRVRKLLSEDGSTAEEIAKVINTDPAIAAKVLRAANSPIYRRSSSCDTTKNAVVRLGLETTRQLVMGFALQDLFKSKNSKLKRRLLETWQHSVEVAAVSFVIARMSNQLQISPEEALLGGLVHDIGYIAVIGFLESHEVLLDDPERLSQYSDMRERAGEHVLKNWQFPEEFIEMAAFGTQWQRDHSGGPDLCDLIQVSKLQSLYGRKASSNLPKIDEIPAFSKLALGDLNKELTLSILENAQQEIADIKALLGI